MKGRAKTLPPMLKRISDGIDDAIHEAKKIREMSIQEEVVQHLDKVNSSLEETQRQISKILKL